MVVYCAQAIMESISRGPNAAAANQDDDDRHHPPAPIVPFPLLNHPNNPPTDSSEEGTVEETTAAGCDGDATASSSSVDHDQQPANNDLNSSSNSSSSSVEKQRAMSSSASSSSSSSSTLTTSSSSSSEGHSTTVVVLPPIIPNLVGATDPSLRMKTYLNELVAYLKEAGESNSTNNSGYEEEEEEDCRKKKKRKKLEQPPSSSQSQLERSASSTNTNTSSNNNKAQPIDTIMHWMDSFQDDETIQLMCLQSLPTVLENPTYRRTAQSDGLASIVLYDMAAFPSNSLLILTAFHTLVVLLRPLGTNEGMVHKASSVAMRQRSTMSCQSDKGIRSISKVSSGLGGVAGGGGGGKSAGGSSSTTTATASIHSVNFKGTQHHPHSKQQRSNSTSSTSSSSSVISNTQLYDPSMKNQLTNWEENGVRVMLDSLRRFSNDRYLQAMGCWAMVNAALYPSLKSGLTRLGGVYAVTNAMMLHPNAEAVQFRGLFALINLVIPERDSNNDRERSGSSIHSHVHQIARLTILAMKNFHTNKSILNRGCLVLRNLSLTPSFVKILGRTPGCVDMLLHCRQICPRDVLVQRSARTIMVMIQRATEKEHELKKVHHHDRHSFTLTQPFPVPSREREEAVDRSSSLSTTTPTLSLDESQRKR
mmetsp:Transcript_3117/g.5263  ORF Transcript_3117/g.5263 Transcript_3117/m.5263 type:complete len:649 (+) Transcript_3117:268-2214(+)